jgi:hypothetical protein
MNRTIIGLAVGALVLTGCGTAGHSTTSSHPTASKVDDNVARFTRDVWNKTDIENQKTNASICEGVHSYGVNWAADASIASGASSVHIISPRHS